MPVRSIKMMRALFGAAKNPDIAKRLGIHPGVAAHEKAKYDLSKVTKSIKKSPTGIITEKTATKHVEQPGRTWKADKERWNKRKQRQVRSKRMKQNYQRADGGPVSLLQTFGYSKGPMSGYGAGPRNDKFSNGRAPLRLMRSKQFNGPDKFGGRNSKFNDPTGPKPPTQGPMGWPDNTGRQQPKMPVVPMATPPNATSRAPVAIQPKQDPMLRPRGAPNVAGQGIGQKFPRPRSRRQAPLRGL